jgi:hypothetical protein
MLRTQVSRNAKEKRPIISDEEEERFIDMAVHFSTKDIQSEIAVDEFPDISSFLFVTNYAFNSDILKL